MNNHMCPMCDYQLTLLARFPGDNWSANNDITQYVGGPTGQAMHSRMDELAGGLRAFYDEMSGQNRGWIVEFGV